MTIFTAFTGVIYFIAKGLQILDEDSLCFPFSLHTNSAQNNQKEYRDLGTEFRKSIMLDGGKKILHFHWSLNLTFPPIMNVDKPHFY